MAKGEDAVRRKKSKVNRKRLQKQDSSASVSARVAAIIASKKRRKSGKRRMCEGMCFSLPTPDDPFNDKLGKKDFEGKESKKQVPRQEDGRCFVHGKGVAPRKGTQTPNTDFKDKVKCSKISINDLVDLEEKVQVIQNVGDHGQSALVRENSNGPSKFLIMCLNSIENALRHDGTFISKEDQPLFVNSWGIEFWKCYSAGKDILETSGASSTVEQIAWMISIAADTIARKEKEGLSFASPFLLFLVPSQEKAAKVRSVCKPLKALGIHSVSIHPGASLDHQIQGLKSCEPEFLVSTPERLLELVMFKAIDISGVSLLVADGLESLSNGGNPDMMKSIRQSISGTPLTVVFNDCFNHASVPLVQNLLSGSIHRISLNDTITSLSSCIIQSVNVCASEDEKLSKGIQILDQAYGDKLLSQPLKVLYILVKDSKFGEMVTTLKNKGYFISTGSSCTISNFKNSKMKNEVSMINMEQIKTTDLEEYGLVIIPNFVLPIDSYVHVLTRMARHTVNGALHSFLTKENAAIAEPLTDILEQCGQAVPEALRDLCLT
ncbi:pre-mRNA-processing ATP-dependent RNA helicase prp5 [Juglans microcarpa x Juglans regia]|uniref:pre-mRNA-processing ATP-dependent RNA helicase prp5 n=1 Tax=Juglans microcarpa x Juglans regia TaxID=2249226 RepID=UPI001B7E866A|nr:pre-mRNA-processing ATP-dependent RNA helicase prp5 [Juglans microcarpa x Juglans regia]